MGLREHQIGKGTLGYKGETAEYFESKRGLWDHFRWVLAAICLVLGVASSSRRPPRWSRRALCR
jgi:hypothetical protein